MDHDQVIDMVARDAALDREAAERATRATLQTLAERVGRYEARHIVPQLPPELGGWFFAEVGHAQGFDIDEFVRRVAEREGVDPVAAAQHAHAVLIALGRTLSDEEYEHLLARLPRDFVTVLPKGSYAGGVPDFVSRVAARTGGDEATARRATAAVLETLAERIAPGDADDLITRLPFALHEPLRRGRSHNDPTMTAAEFLVRVAERAALTADDAGRYARAVFATLRETIPEEYFDAVVQLPGEYDDLVAGT
jgi:uncharacterized protein (DUF2267 family)